MFINYKVEWSYRKLHTYYIYTHINVVSSLTDNNGSHSIVAAEEEKHMTYFFMTLPCAPSSSALIVR